MLKQVNAVFHFQSSFSLISSSSTGSMASRGFSIYLFKYFDTFVPFIKQEAKPTTKVWFAHVLPHTAFIIQATVHQHELHIRSREQEWKYMASVLPLLFSSNQIGLFADVSVKLFELKWRETSRRRKNVCVCLVGNYKNDKERETTEQWMRLFWETFNCKKCWVKCRSISISFFISFSLSLTLRPVVVCKF